jgi:hypothetical protein
LEGAPSVLGRAWRRAQEQIAASDYRLPDAAGREVEAIFRRAAAHVLRGAES